MKKARFKIGDFVEVQESSIIRIEKIRKKKQWQYSGVYTFTGDLTRQWHKENDIKKIMKQLTREQADRFIKSKAGKKLGDRELIRYQLHQQFLIMDYEQFKVVLEAIIGKPVETKHLCYPRKNKILKRFHRITGTKEPRFSSFKNAIPKTKLHFILNGKNEKNKKTKMRRTR